MGPKRKLKTVLSKHEQPKAKKLKIEEKDVKEAKEEPAEENEDEKIEEEKPRKKTYKKYVRIPRIIDGDPKSRFVWKRYPSLFLELKDANPDIKLKDLKNITCGSSRILNWKCLNHKSCNMHVWKATVGSRTYHGTGCPYCFARGKHKKECLCSQPKFKNPDGSYKHGQEHMKRCSNCNEEKPNCEFNVHIAKKGNYTSWCSVCINEKALFDQAVRSAIMRHFLQGKCCQDCGAKNDVVLEFDHVNNDKAKDGNGKPRNMLNLPPHNLCMEFKKTDIVCVKCHRIRTLSRHARKSNAPTEESKLKRRLAEKLKLKRQCCLHCKTPITKDETHLFDCDHIDPDQKIEAVSQMILKKQYTVKDVEQEIAKCQLLCCNCHRSKTAKDGNWRKLSDFSPEIIAKAQFFLDQHFQKDALGNYIHIRPVKVQIGPLGQPQNSSQVLPQPQNPIQFQSTINWLALVPSLEM